VKRTDFQFSFFQMARQRAAQDAKRQEREMAMKERQQQSKAAKQAQKAQKATGARKTPSHSDGATEARPHSDARPSRNEVAGAYGSHFRNSFEWQQAPNVHASVHTDTYQTSVAVVTTDNYRSGHHRSGTHDTTAAADAAAIAEVREAARAAGVFGSTELMFFEANALSLDTAPSDGAHVATGGNHDRSAESASTHRSHSQHHRAPQRQSHRQSDRHAASSAAAQPLATRHSRSPAPHSSRRKSRNSNGGSSGGSGSSSSRQGGDQDGSGVKNGGACVICMDAPANYLVLPCGHQCGCQPCLNAVARGPHPQCPICRTPLTGSVRVFAAGYDASGEDDAAAPPPPRPAAPPAPAPTQPPPPRPSTAPPPHSASGAGIRAQDTSGPVHLNDFFDPPSHHAPTAPPPPPPPRRAPERYATAQPAANHQSPSNNDGPVRRFGGTGSVRQSSEAELAAEEARRVNRRAISEALARQSTSTSSDDSSEMSSAAGHRSMRF